MKTCWKVWVLDFSPLLMCYRHFFVNQFATWTICFPVKFFSSSTCGHTNTCKTPVCVQLQIWHRLHFIRKEKNDELRVNRQRVNKRFSVSQCFSHQYSTSIFSNNLCMRVFAFICTWTTLKNNYNGDIIKLLKRSCKKLFLGCVAEQKHENINLMVTTYE